jgi:hypothetical protein
MQKLGCGLRVSSRDFEPRPRSLGFRHPAAVGQIEIELAVSLQKLTFALGQHRHAVHVQKTP